MEDNKGIYIEKKEDVEPGIYRHFKGKYYYVIAVAKDEKTLEKKVVYSSLYDVGIWIRPLKEFTEKVVYKGRKRKRFTRSLNEEKKIRSVNMDLYENLVKFSENPKDNALKLLCEKKFIFRKELIEKLLKDSLEV